MMMSPFARISTVYCQTGVNLPIWLVYRRLDAAMINTARVCFRQ